MKIREFFSNLICERRFRWYLAAFISFVASIAFATYNFIVGIIFKLVWNFSVSFYYIILTVIKAIILYSEKKWKSQPLALTSKKRVTLFMVESIFLLLIDVALIAPITLLISQDNPSVNIGMIPSIAVAAYTTYNITMACINYTKSKKTDNLSLHGLKVISLKEAIVSIITLQNTLVVVFGDAGEMLTLTAWTSFGMFLSLVLISILQFVKLKKIKNQATE